MAKKTFKNQGGQVEFTFRNGRPPIFVPAGGSYTTDDDEEQTALRKAGFTESKAESKSESKSSYFKKEKE